MEAEDERFETEGLLTPWDRGERASTPHSGSGFGTVETTNCKHSFRMERSSLGRSERAAVASRTPSHLALREEHKPGQELALRAERVMPSSSFAQAQCPQTGSEVAASIRPEPPWRVPSSPRRHAEGPRRPSALPEPLRHVLSPDPEPTPGHTAPGNPPGCCAPARESAHDRVLQGSHTQCCNSDSATFMQWSF